jgi:hypothetical protein
LAAFTDVTAEAIPDLPTGSPGFGKGPDQGPIATTPPRAPTAIHRLP